MLKAKTQADVDAIVQKYSGVVGRCAIKWSDKLKEEMEEKNGKKIEEGGITSADFQKAFKKMQTLSAI